MKTSPFKRIHTVVLALTITFLGAGMLWAADEPVKEKQPAVEFIYTFMPILVIAGLLWLFLRSSQRSPFMRRSIQYGDPVSLGTTVAWTGKTRSGISCQLFKTTWQNPRPDAEITTIDYASELKGTAPFLMANTVE